MRKEASPRVLLKLLCIAAGGGLGLAVGFALRSMTGSKVQNPPLPVTSASLRPANRKILRPTIPAKDDSPLATQLELDLAMSAGVTKWLYWLDALEKAAPTDFPRLVHLAQGNPAALRLVQARWIATAPRHLFDTIVAGLKDNHGLPINELAYALLNEWPKHDPDAAIAALNGTENCRTREHWRFDVAYAVLEKDVERGLRLLAEWHANDVGFGSRGLATIAKWTRADPRHAAEFMLAQPDAYSFRSTMETIGKEWSKTDPAGALDFATSKPGNLSSMLATSVLKDWAEKNFDQAADWLGSADEPARNRLSPTFVEAWAKQDAPGALAWCEANLAGTTLAQAVSGVMRGAAEKDVGAAGALVAEMSPSHARSEAAVTVALKWFPGSTYETSHQPATAEAINWLGSLDADATKRVLDQITWNWGTADPKSMAAFLLKTSSQQVPPYTYTVVARELVRNDPMDALDWASRLPRQQGLNAGGEAFAEWRGSQPEAAMEWFNGLPPDDARRQSFFEGAIRSLAYHPQAAEQLAAMNGPQRAEARRVIETMNLAEDRRARLLDLLSRK